MRHPEKIERQVQCILQAGPLVGFVYAWSVVIDEEGWLVSAVCKWDVEGMIYRALICRNFISNASVPLISRACLDRVGGYSNQRDQGGQGCEDWDMVLRLAEHYEVRFVPAYLVAYRQVKASMSKSCKPMAKSYELLIEGIEQRHPEIPAKIYLWSKGGFYRYLAGISCQSGDRWHALHWAYKALSKDPMMIWSPQMVNLIVRSLLGIAGKSVTSTRRNCAQLNFEQKSSFKDQWKNILSEIEKDIPIRKDAKFESNPWKLRNPYDRICVRRWRQVTKLQ